MSKTEHEQTNFTEPSIEDKFAFRWKQIREEISVINSAIVEFYNVHDQAEVEGNKKKKIPPRPELQLTVELLRKRARELHNECNTMLASAYTGNMGSRREFKAKLFM